MISISLLYVKMILFYFYDSIQIKPNQAQYHRFSSICAQYSVSRANYFVKNLVWIDRQYYFNALGAARPAFCVFSTSVQLGEPNCLGCR